jgi:hypothetical protein
MVPHQTAHHAQSWIETRACVSVIVCPSIHQLYVLSAKSCFFQQNRTSFFFQQYFFKKKHCISLSKVIFLSAKLHFFQQNGFSKMI